MEENYTKKDKPISKVFSGIFDVIESLVYAVAVVVLIFLFIGKLSKVDGTSMNNTLSHNDYLYVSNPLFLYEPQNDDIVVVHGDFNGSYYDKPIVKRVIASGNQEVKIDLRNNTVTIDGIVKNEDYIIRADRYGYEVSEQDYVDYHTNLFLTQQLTNGLNYDMISGIISFKVTDNHYFVMGDNRLNSADSRYSSIGFVHKDYIVGKAVLRLLPFNKFGGI